MPPNGNASIIKNVTTMDAANYNLEDNEQVARRRSRQTSMVTNENNSPNKSVEGSSKTGSTGKRLKSSTYRRLGEAVTQVGGLSYCSLCGIFQFNRNLCDNCSTVVGKLRGKKRQIF